MSHAKGLSAAEAEMQAAMGRSAPQRPADAAETVTLATAQEMAATAAREAVQAAMGPLMAMLAANNGGSGDTLATVLEGFTKAIGSITAQSAGKKFVAPEVLAKREAARLRMEDLLAEARKANSLPRYKLVHAVVFDDTLLGPVVVDPATKKQEARTLGWRLAPNMAMRPLDERAEAIFAAFLESIGENPPPSDAAPTFKPGSITILSGVDAATSRAGTVSGNLELEGANATGRLEYNAVLGTLAPAAVQQAA